MPVAVIFDMDGLIFDTETLYQEAFLAAAAVGGHDLPTAVIQRTIGVPWVQSRVLLLEQMGPDFPIDQYFAQMIGHFELLAATQLRLKPGVVELLDFLDQLAMPRCIATSSAHSTVQSHLSAHGLADRFHAVIGHRLCRQQTLARPVPDGGEASWRGPHSMPGSGGFPQRGSLRICCRNDDFHGPRSSWPNPGNPVPMHGRCQRPACRPRAHPGRVGRARRRMTVRRSPSGAADRKQMTATTAHPADLHDATSSGIH